MFNKKLKKQLWKQLVVKKMSNNTILYDSDKVSKSLTKAIGYIIAILCILAIGAGIYFVINLSPVDSNDSTEIPFHIEQGWSTTKIVEELKDKDLIKNSFVLKIYIKITNKSQFLAGTYLLNKAMPVDDILDTLSSNKSLDNKQVSVTLIEGKRLPEYAEKLAENFEFTKEDFMNKVSDKDYLNLLIEKYWFITNKINDPSIYYPLEGYLFADTYSFRVNSSIEDVVTILLDGMKNKLAKLGINENSNVDVHELLTLASMTELEAKTPEDRKMVSGIFKNRLNKGMTLGSDVTTYYATKKAFIDSLTMQELNDCNAYNTRGTCVSGLPIGPICTPSYSAIEAAYNPTESDNLYFVADKNGKTYFGKTEAEHQRNINNLKNQGLWLE